MDDKTPDLKSQRRNQGSWLWKWLAVLVLLLGVGWLYDHRQWLIDWQAAQRFQLSTEISTMQQRLELTERADLVLRASQPVLQTSEQFNQNCPRQEVTSYILGCYVENRIYVYQVDSEELDGANEVTLAHEFLHAAYQRLDDGERDKVDRLLQADYRRLQTEELSSRMRMYQRTEPDQFENELHSILATEFRDLSSELEQYYQRYFKNRLAVVALHEQYNDKFIEKQQRMDQLEAEIDQLTAKYQTEAAAFSADANSLDNEVTDFNSRALSSSFRWSSQWEFDNERNQLLARQQAIETQYNDLRAQENQINKLIDQYNELALAIQKMTKKLDSLTPVKEVE